MGQTKNGDVRTVGDTRADRARSNQRTDSCGGGGYSGEWQETKRAYQEAVIKLMLRDDGYMRCIPDGEQKLVYIKWKFTSGRFQGRYVMAVVTPYAIEEGYLLVMEKIERSYTGSFTPSADPVYRGD